MYLTWGVNVSSLEAERGMQTGKSFVLSLSKDAPPLDSRFRGNDGLRMPTPVSPLEGNTLRSGSYGVMACALRMQLDDVAVG